MTTTTAPPRSLAERATDRLAHLLAGRDLSRRRFLFRLAVVGSALAIDPLRYVLRPGSAYATVCGRGASCDSGWSVFCCTINGGANTCPDGSYVAGWWKVDDSAFCNGSPRYYVDCNRSPDASCDCRCNDTGCDTRRTCCNDFRYGQCNTDVPGTTEVVCRVVLCTPPWEWDPACGRTVRTAETTRTHSAACLPGTNPSPIDVVYQDAGLTGSRYGAPVSAEVRGARGGLKRNYEHGMLLWHPATGVIAVMGRVRDVYAANGAENGPLGYATAGVVAVAGGVSQRFEGGVIAGPAADDVAAIHGPVYDAYRRAGGVGGSWGLPLSGHVPEAGGTVTRFENGTTYLSPSGQVVFLGDGAILDRYEQEGGPSGPLGYPTSGGLETVDGRTRVQLSRGAIERNATGTRVVTPRTGRPAGDLPEATPDATARPGRDPSELP